LTPIYLDFNASTPVAPEVATAMRSLLEAHYGNPSSAPWAGRTTTEAEIDDVVERLRRLVPAINEAA